MDLLGTVLLLVLVGSEAQNLVNVTVELGQDVTLNCSFNSSDFFWFMKIHSQFRAEIGRIRSSSSPVCSSPDFKSKFSMSGNQLVIKTVSAEDSRLYYCGMRQSDQMVYKDTFSLSVVPSVRPTTSIPSIPSIPSVPRSSTPPCPATGRFVQPVTAVSLGLNAVLLAAAVGFLCVYIRRNGSCSCCCRAKGSAAYNMENDDMQSPQYEEIQLPPTPVPVRVSSECIYYKAQHPNSKMRQY
ncbi:uncharacterized protein LOC114140628 isoform X1 [Xiphophorus couchianus]|uniref:uncharacterized protein LOC114140628 isoform X1 n=1 Tax=Xiphophorus couchianus TaxID=32473 RepID=UPI0010162AF4|nr:uncharacterized protein LOC114140628 isoform X1 [Xiphophorus couchianus]XP_027866540.1 uncharacterized protein LOC114140628 isoform X1 [Xiphophorus couchianus]XP_027866541.1 uncharacterized protein LOC114140628 isoform X1 [Xiphophorus couchianus]XP_027866542.1 uncharacterized protein LOC114140628 isoform X1 [Xiphophorus couchianus]